MPKTLQHFLIAFILFLGVCVCTFVFITPYSFTSFIGPAAGISTALMIFYGARVVSAIILATLLYCLFLYYWLAMPIESSMVVIALLTFTLQGLWAKQITVKEVNRQKWLKSRFVLLKLLFKVGPLTSCVAAFSVTVLAMLENETFGENLFFTIASCWASSVLSAIFFTPLFLLYQSRYPISLSKRLFVTVSSILAIVAISLLFNISQNFQQHQRQDSFNQIQSKLLLSIEKELTNTSDILNSLSALLKVNHNITRSEFNVYSRQILKEKSSIRVLEWAPIIDQEGKQYFEENIRPINEKNPEGKLKTAGVRNSYAPIKYVYPSLNNEQIIGLDILTNSKVVIDMDRVSTRQAVTASAPLSLLQDEYSNLGVLFILPVPSALDSANDNSAQVFKQENGSNLLGFVVAVVQFEDFFQQLSSLNSDSIALFIEDVTSSDPYTIFGQQLNTNFRYVNSTYIDVNLRKWRVSIGEKQPWQLQNRNWQVWGMLIGATFGGGLFQVLILMMAVYSNELSSQVVKKTRELIIAKEKSDYKNKAKTNFLYTLTRDLQIPLKAITHFSNQLYQTDIKEQKTVIKNIELAQLNMHKLLHMVFDLSKIELGELNVNSEPFDFYGFISRVDSMLRASMLNEKRNITFLINSNVPHFINSDELRIQQLLMAISEGVHKLFNVNNMRVSIKIHNLNSSSAILFFVFTSHDEQLADSKVPFDDFVSKDLTLFNTEMAMAKEVCQLMDGDANLAISTSGERVLTASVRIDITSNAEQQAHQAKLFDEKFDK
jgi:CHASE1-domain containing sensor protein